MQKHQSSGIGSSALLQSVPADIGEASQRRRIVAAMIDSCAEKTYAATTIADIVSRARVSRTTFYKRFPHKRACFDAAVAVCLDELRDAATAAHSPEDPPAETVRRAAAATLGAMSDRPALAQLLAGEAISVDPGLLRRYRGLVIPALECLWERPGTAGDRHIDPRLAFGRAHLLILNQIASGHSEDLPSLLPDLVYLAVAPFAGHEEALEEARLARAIAPDPAPRS